jgi:integrase
VLDAAKVDGLRSGENPARWRGHLEHKLARGAHKVEGHAALSYVELPTFMAELRAVNTVAARALEFAILTGSRTGEVVGNRRQKVAPLTWREINFDDACWRIPAERMKRDQMHQVPLSTRALEILNAIPRGADSDVVFAVTEGDHSLRRALKRLRKDITPHGFRSTFSTWANEKTTHQSNVIEYALAHATGDVTEQAYRRASFYLKRIPLMEDWCTYCGKVVALRAAA